MNPETLKVPYGNGMNGVQVDGKTFSKGYKPEDLPFTGNGMSGGMETDCVTPEYEFLKTSANEFGVYDINSGAELYIVTQEGEEILIAIFKEDIDRTDGNKGMFIRLEDYNE